MPSNSDSLKLTLPSGLVSGTDPLRVAISASLTKLQKSLEPDENGQINFVPVAWHFRDTVDMFTMLAVSIAVAPLAPSDAPLPGWRRRLWHSRFSEAAPELLNWAVSYLPRRCRAGNLASNAMQLLFGPGVEVVTGPALPCTALLGMGTAAEASGNEWKRWRDAFFGCTDLKALPELAKDVTQFFRHLQELMIAFDNFLSLWNVKVVRRGNYARLMLQGAGSHELPPFFAVMECPHCHRMESLFGLVSARAGDNFLYAEVGTGHLIDAPIDITFKRRFFAQPSRRVSNSRENLFSVSAEPLADVKENSSAPVDDAKIAAAEHEVVGVVGEQVYNQYHLPVLAVVAEADGQFPLELLNDPSLGCSDGEVLLGHLNKLLQCENGVISCLPGISAEKLHTLVHSRAVDTCAQLAYWSEDRVVNGGGHDKMDRMAITHLAKWVVKSREKRLLQRLLNNHKAVDRIVDWLQRQAQDGRHLDRVLQVSDDWLALWNERPEYNSYIVNMKVMRAECWQRLNDIDKAKEELNGAVAITEQDVDELRLMRAKALCSRARLNTELKEYTLAGEDAVLAVDTLSSAINTADAETLNSFLDAVWLQAQAMLSLEANVQAIAALHRAVWANLEPPEDRERVKLARINFLLAKLQSAEKNCNVWSVRSAYASVLKLLEENPRQEREIAEMWALSKAGVLRFSEEMPSLEALFEVKGLLTKLIAEEKNAALIEALVWIEKKAVEIKERTVKQLMLADSDDRELESQIALKDVLQELQEAIEADIMLSELVPNEANRIDLASLWEKQAHLQIGVNRDGELKALNNAWDIYRELLDKGCMDVQDHFAQLWIDRGLLLMHCDGAEALRELQAVADYWAELPEDKRVHPRYIELFNALSSLYDTQDDQEKSLLSLNRAVEVTRACSTRFTAGDAQKKDPQKKDPQKKDGQKNDGQKTEDKDSGSTELWQARLAQLLRIRVWRLYNSGSWPEASADFAELMTLLEDAAEVKRLRFARALTNLRAGRYEDSHQDFEILSREGSLLGTAGAGWAMYGLRDAGQAVHYFRQIIESEEPVDLKADRIAAVWARWGLAEVYAISDNAAQAKRERLQAMSVWLGEDFAADAEINAEELRTEAGLADWEFASVLLWGTYELISEEKYAEAQMTLQQARILTQVPFVPEEFSRRVSMAQLLEVKLLALSGRKEQALLGGFAWLKQGTPKSGSADLSAWVSLFCARELVEKKEYNADAVQKLESIVEVLQHGSENGDESAQVYWALLVAILARFCTEADPEREVRPGLEKAEKLLYTLRKSKDERVYCWEIVYIYSVQLLIALRHNRTSKSALMLTRMADALNKAVDPLPLLHWCKPVTLDLILEILNYEFPPSVEIASAWARLLACPVWDEKCLAAIDEACSRFVPQTSGRYWKEMAAIAEAIMIHPEIEASGESSKLLGSWWQRIQELCAAEDEEGMVSLLAFCELILARIESSCWPENCPWQAYSLLVECLAKDDNKAETLAWMSRAPAFIEKNCSAEERAQRLTQIELERAIILFEVDRISEAAMAVEDAEAIVEEAYYENPPADLVEQINEVRKLLDPDAEIGESGLSDIKAAVQSEKASVLSKVPVDSGAEEAAAAQEEEPAASEASADGVSAEDGIASVQEDFSAASETEEAGVSAQEEATAADESAADGAFVAPETAPSQEEVPAVPETSADAAYAEDGDASAQEDVSAASETEAAGAPTQEEMPAVAEDAAASVTSANAPTQEEMPAVAEAEADSAAAEPAPSPEEMPAAPAASLSQEDIDVAAEAARIGASVSGAATVIDSAVPAAGVSGAAAVIDSAVPAAGAAEAGSDRVEETEMGEIAAVLNIFDQGSALDSGAAPFGVSTGIMTAPDKASLASMSAAETSLGAPADEQAAAAPAAAPSIDSQISQTGAIDGASELLGAPDSAGGGDLLGAPSESPEAAAETVLLGAPDSEPVRGENSELPGASDSGPEPASASAKSSGKPKIEEAEAPAPPEEGLASPKAIEAALESLPEDRREAARAWLSEMNAHIDNGFAWLDRRGTGQAEKTFWYVGGRLAECPALAGSLMAGLLEGCVETARAFAAGGFKQEAIRLIARACVLGREFLGDNYDRDAWAWWGDAERLAGTMMHDVGKASEAVDYLFQARNIFSEMLQRSKNPEARIDLFRISASRASLLLEMGFVPDAMEEYRIAIENGLQVLVDGFHEEMAVASLHVARGRLAIETGQLEMAAHDYTWALETYEQLFIDDVDCVMEMCTARAGLAEAFAYLGNMPKMKEHFKGLLACRAQLESEGKYNQVAVLDDLLDNLNELGRTLFG